MLDQVFVLLKHWLLGYSPAVIQPAVSILLTIVPILLVFPVLFALTTVLERKGLGRNAKPLWSESGGILWHSAADGGCDEVT